MKQLIAIAAGGAVGALMRYGMSNAVYSIMGRSFLLFHARFYILLMLSLVQFS